MHSKTTLPPQSQDKHPGKEHEMYPEPKYKAEWYTGANKLKNKVALITGGDSGIGRATAVLFAREGASVAIVYLDEDTDANQTKKDVEAEGQTCLLIKGDIRSQEFCESAVAETIAKFDTLDILVNNAAVQYPEESITDITQKKLQKTFETNIYSYFYFAKAAVPHLKKDSVIINTTSVTAYRGSHHLIDYSSTKGAIVTFTRSLSQALSEKGIRVNGVAPGPVWTPLIPSSFSEEKVATFGGNVPLGRPAHPEEIAPSFVFLASRDSSYYTGQILHPNGGEIVNA